MSDSSPIGALGVVVAILSVAALGAARPRSDGIEIPPPVHRVRAGESHEPALPLDLNQASARELEALPRVGPALAARIVAYREARGAFASVDDLDAVKGVGPRMLEQLRPLVRVASAADQNRSSRNPQRSTSEVSTRPAPSIVPRQSTSVRRSIPTNPEPTRRSIPSRR